MKCSAGGLLLVFSPLLWSANGLSQDFSLQIKAPAAGTVAADSVAVRVSVTSTYELASVVAKVDGASTNLAFSPADSTWANTLSLVGLSGGQKTLIITASDVFGSSSAVQTVFTHDYPAVLTITEPWDQTVATPALMINATAVSSNPGGTVISVTLGGNLIASGTNTLLTSVNIPTEGVQTLTFSATNSGGQVTSVDRTVLAFNATNWTRVDRVHGRVLDANSDSVLFVDEASFKIKSRISGIERVLFQNPYPYEWAAGVLTPQGAILHPGGCCFPFYEWRAGTVTNLSEGVFFGASQQYALWWARSGYLVRYDLASGTTNWFQNGIGFLDGASLAPNGDVAYVWEPWHNNLWGVAWYHQGSLTNLARSNFDYRYEGAQSDGTNVIYGKVALLAGPNYSALNNGTGEIILSTNSSGYYASFAINSGWVAFSTTGQSGVDQVWLRSPSGQQSQATFFGTASAVEALGPEGQLIFRNRGRAYLAQRNASPLDLGYDWTFEPDQAGNAKFYWQDGVLHFRLGDSLFTLGGRVTLTANSTGTGQLRIGLNAAPNTRVITQCSTNLTDWVNVSTNVLSNTNHLEITDLVTPPTSAKFYRALTSQ